MFKNALLRLVCYALLAAAVLGQTKVVTLKNGQKMTGEVTKTETGYEIKTASGITIALRADQVVSVVDAVTPEDEYKKKLAKIDPDSAKDHLALGKWASEAGMLEIARKELMTALSLKGDMEEASLLLRQVEVMIAQLQEKKTPGGKVTRKPLPPSGGRGSIRPEWLVGQDDIRRIRLEELREGDRVAIQFRNDVIDRFIESMAGIGDFENPGAADQFKRRPRVWQALYILDNIDRSNVAIKDDIIIKRDPGFMLDFRSRVWPIIARNCATASCHGGNKPLGGWKVFSIPGRNEKIDYTNFILTDGFARQGMRMIDRDHSDRSLLLEYGLPPEQGRYQHPVTIRHAYRSRNSVNYRRVLEWINSLQGPPHPDYRLQYKPPLGMKLDLKDVPSLPPPSEEESPEEDKTGREEEAEVSPLEKPSP